MKKTIIMRHVPGTGTGTSRVEICNKNASSKPSVDMVFKTDILNRILPYIPDLNKAAKVTIVMTDVVELDKDTFAPIAAPKKPEIYTPPIAENDQKQFKR